MKTMQLMTFVLLTIFAACKSKDDSLTQLRAHEWQLKSMMENDTIVINPQELPTLLFSDSSAVYGMAGCNRFFGTYTTGEQGAMTLKPGGSTMMFCPDMNFEDRYLKALGKVDSYTVYNKELKLKGESGKLQLIYVPVDTTERVGVAKDEHGCNAAAGFTWSEVRQDCIRLFEEGVKLVSETDKTSSSAAYIVFSADSLQAEVFMPQNEKHTVLERKSLPKGGYTWNDDDDDTLNIRRVNDKWIIEQREKVLYSEAEK